MDGWMHAPSWRRMAHGGRNELHKYTNKYKNLQRRQGVARGVKCLLKFTTILTTKDLGQLARQRSFSSYTKLSVYTSRVGLYRGLHKYTSKYNNPQRRQGVARGAKCLAQIYHDPYNQTLGAHGASFGCSGFGKFGFFFSLSWQARKPSDEIRGRIETRKRPSKPYQLERIIHRKTSEVKWN